MKKIHLVKPIKSINYFSFFLMFSLLLGTANYAQQITGLSGWNIFLDPGHSQKENMGIYNYSWFFLRWDFNLIYSIFCIEFFFRFDKIILQCCRCCYDFES